mgnify:CR=1 FL=1
MQELPINTLNWEDYGYLDYVTYSDWLNELVSSGELTEEERSAVVGFGRTKAQDSEQVSEYVKKFTKYYKSQGYTVVRKDAVMMNKKKYADGGQQQLFAAVFARSGHQVCRDAADDVGRERQHKMAGDEEEQAHHKAHDRDAAEFFAAWRPAAYRRCRRSARPRRAAECCPRPAAVHRRRSPR